MEVIKQIILLVLTPNCYDEYFIKYNFFDDECFKATLSKCLGLGVIAGSVFVKFPQIIKIYNSKSGEGINLLSVMLDLTAITIYASYSYVKQFPFSAWGDTAFLALQTAAVGFLVLYYSGMPFKAVGFILIYAVICIVLMSGFTPIKILWSLQGFNIPILLSGKLAQAYTNYSNGNTGQLSALTVFMLFFGSLARIFTSIQETGDAMTVITCISSTLANTVITLQMWYYWNVSAGVKEKVQ